MWKAKVPAHRMLLFYLKGKGADEERVVGSLTVKEEVKKQFAITGNHKKMIGWEEDADILRSSVDLESTNMKEIIYNSKQFIKGKEDKVKERIKQSHKKVLRFA